MKLNIRLTQQAFALLVLGVSLNANAAVGLDRTRVIFDGGKDATSVNITNNNTQLPYLAQGWIEDEAGKKITTPLIVLPPVQRLEPGKQSQVKVQALPAAKLLPQDRETVYYFNLREIPPRSDKANTLQIALQTRIKLFYRPQAITPTQQDLSNPWQEKLTLTREGDSGRGTVVLAPGEERDAGDGAGRRIDRRSRHGAKASAARERDSDGILVARAASTEREAGDLVS